MMTSHRRRYSADFKAKIALEAIKADRTINEIAALHEIHPNQIALWKKQLLEELPQIFADKRVKANKDHEALQDRLYRQIGQLQVELDWLKKKSGLAG
jgi:transposase